MVRKPAGHDDFGREFLAPVVDNSLSGIRVARELDWVVRVRGTPCVIVSDNGTELTSRAMLVWQQEHGVEWHYIAPGKPMQNIPHLLAFLGALDVDTIGHAASTCLPQKQQTPLFPYQFAKQAQCFPHFPALLDGGLTETAMLPA